MKIIFIGGLVNGKLIVEHILKNKEISLPLIFTHPLNFKIQSYDNFNKFTKKTKIIRNINVNKHYRQIKSINPDLIIVAGWSWLISEKILKLPRLGTVGFHPSLLPKDRGRSVLAWQIEEGYTETALSMFYITKGVDDGDIIAQNKIKILKSDTIKNILNKCNIETSKQIKKYLQLILKGQAPRRKQNKKLSTYRPLRTDENSIIDWNKNKKFIYNKIRAISDPYPGAFFINKRRRIYVKKGIIVNNKVILKIAHKYNSGEIVKLYNYKDCIIKCANGLIRVKTTNEIKKN